MCVEGENSSRAPGLVYIESIMANSGAATGIIRHQAERGHFSADGWVKGHEAKHGVPLEILAAMVEPGGQRLAANPSQELMSSVSTLNLSDHLTDPKILGCKMRLLIRWGPETDFKQTEICQNGLTWQLEFQFKKGLGGTTGVASKDGINYWSYQSNKCL